MSERVEKVGPFTVYVTAACPANETFLFGRPLVWTGHGLAVLGDDGVPRPPAPGEVARVVFDEPDRLPDGARFASPGARWYLGG